MNPDKQESMPRRSLTHDVAAIVIMGFYGGQVCPFVDNLDLGAWFLELTIIFGIIVTTVILLVLFKDLNWLLNTPSLDPNEAKMAVLKETVFIAAVFLAYIVNLIFSYSHNLKRLVGTSVTPDPRPAILRADSRAYY